MAADVDARTGIHDPLVLTDKWAVSTEGLQYTDKCEGWFRVSRDLTTGHDFLHERLCCAF